ncbi:hypothetical protein [Albidovulum sp.]
MSMSISSRIAGLVLPLFVVGCAQQNEPPKPIQGQPVFNKYGEQVGCESGVFIPGAPEQFQCRPPEECAPNTAFAAYNPACLQPGRQPGDRGGRSGQQNQTGVNIP